MNPTKAQRAVKTRRRGVFGRRRYFRTATAPLEPAVEEWLRLNEKRLGFPDLGELALLYFFSYADPQIAKVYEAQMLRLAPKMNKPK